MWKYGLQRKGKHLEMDVRVEYLCAIPHRRRHQRVLLRHIEQHLEHAALVWCIFWTLRVLKHAIALQLAWTRLKLKHQMLCVRRNAP